ncbi:MAG: hypothetical protein ACKOAS_04355, partial [Verrucomicrobiota bacterium]
TASTPVTEPKPAAKPIPAKLEISTQPLQSIAGRPMDPAPAARVLTDSGEPFPGVEVTFALDRGAFASSSQTSALTDSNGIASFSALVIEKAENFYSLAFTAPDLPSATSMQFNIRFAPPRHLAVSKQPSASRVSKPLAGPPAVLVTDTFGNPVPRVPVTVSVAEPPNTEPKGKTRIVTDESGLAIFDALQLPRASKKTILRFDAAAAGVPDTLSDPFPVR